jgi:hypothetical protein
MDVADAEDVVTAAIEALPKHITMVYVDYDSKLSDEQVREIIENHDVDAVEESMRDGWMWEHEHYTLDYHINDELKTALETWHEEHGIELCDDGWVNVDEFKDDAAFEGELERFKDAIYDRDDSNTMRDLIRHTPSYGVTFRPMEWYYDDGATMDDIKAMVALYDLQSDEPRWIERLLESANVGGGYFMVQVYDDLDDLIDWISKENYGSTDRIPDPILRFRKAEISIDGYDTITANGKIPLSLKDNEMELRLDTEFWSPPSSYSIESMMEDYKKGLVDFYQYRAKIMEGTRG